MRTFVRVLAALLVVALVIGIGTAVYNAGVDAGLAAAPALASGDPVPVGAYGPYVHGWYGHDWGFGFFGIFFWILGIFLIFGLLRFAFGGAGRWGGPGPGRGGWSDRRERLEEWHAEMHRRDDARASVQES